jgi:flagellar basal-body rod modification protein FlgD
LQAQLGQDAFLKLLVTEMRLQDPMHTMEDKEFIAQLAQFSTLEQTKKMGDGLLSLAQGNASTQAVSLIGKTIEYADPSSDSLLTGKVDSVRFSDGSPVLMVGGKEVKPENVASVR